jgi:phosphoglycerate dehydrogenase-like enzyme
VLAVVVLTKPGAPAPDLAAIKDHADVRFTDVAGLSGALVDADVLLAWDYRAGDVHNGWPPATALQWIHVASAGVNGILFDELVASDVIVTNSRGVFDRAIAEFVLGYILAVAKDTYRSHELQLAHEWHHREIDSLTAQTALIVGTGSIGRETARLLRAVGVQVRGAGRRECDHDADFGTVVSSADLAAEVGWADHVVIATPLTPQTQGLVNAKVIAAMKPSAHLINVARGACVVEADLIAALQRGHLGGASLDVVEREPLAPDDPLWSAPRIHITPHMSGDVHGYLEALAEQFVTNFEHFVAGRPLVNVVDKRLGYVASTSG